MATGGTGSRRPRKPAKTVAAAVVSREDAEAFYDERTGRYDRLLQEVLFSLETALREAGIKTHSVTGRVKAKQSFLEKIERNAYTDLPKEFADAVGLRVVALFLSDLPRIGDAVRAVFDVESVDDKVEGPDPETFGYMSVHYVCTLPAGHAGPRYDDLKGLRFEVQVRTIVMDAWANVSHYLAYKGNASIPPELRRDFFALSGLFYVADQHFELFFKSAAESQESAQEAMENEEDADLDLNLETMIPLLRQLYPDRTAANRETVSDFVQEVVASGYTTVRALRAMLLPVTERALRYEGDHPPFGEVGRRFSDVGIARVALDIADHAHARRTGRYSRRKDY